MKPVHQHNPNFLNSFDICLLWVASRTGKYLPSSGRYPRNFTVDPLSRWNAIWDRLGTNAETTCLKDRWSSMTIVAADPYITFGPSAWADWLPEQSCSNEDLYFRRKTAVDSRNIKILMFLARKSSWVDGGRRRISSPGFHPRGPPSAHEQVSVPSWNFLL